MKRKLNLNGNWYFKENAQTNEWRTGKVPGSVQLDLLKLGKLSDPFYRNNENYAFKLANKNFIYKKRFNFKNNTQYLTAHLVFKGIDTISDIYFNSKHLGSTNNMFMEYRFDISNFLQPGENIIEVNLKSPLKYITSERDSDRLKLIPYDIPRQYIRKAQYSFGWDFAPKIVPMGIWKDVYIEFYDNARLLNPLFLTKKIGKDFAVVLVSCMVDKFNNAEISTQIEILYKNKTISLYKAGNVNKIIKKKFHIKNPHLWYPNGIGPPSLYEIKITLFHKNNIIDKIHFKTGIRKIKLLTKKDGDGKSFIFEINGRKVFIKGANWVPADIFLTRITPNDYKKYIKMAKEANFNMLRVWGGGIYENDIFYQLADKYGIMLWQDFMYACAQYPDHHKLFRKQAEIEADFIVKKLRNHPSIVVWCGNNENNVGFYSWWDCESSPKFLGNYIYKKILPKICKKNAPNSIYRISSPYGGENPNSEKEGDVHNWNIWHGWLDYEAYTNDKSKFASEFGLQSMPNLKTVYSFTEKKDRNIFSPVMLSYQKGNEGMEKLIRYIVSRLKLPKDFESFIYLTQYIQAEGLKIAVEHYRSRKFKTAGSLFWQFNDCWPGISWSSIDYYKRKKALYYYAKKFYDNVLLIIKNEKNSLLLFAVNDTLDMLSAKLYIRVYNLNGKLISKKSNKVKISPNSVTKLNQFSFEDLNIVPKTNEKNFSLPYIIFGELKTKYGNHTNYQILDKIYKLNFKKPHFYIKKKGRTIILSSDFPATGVFIEAKNEVDFSDNCLTMEPKKDYKIKCSTLPKKISVKSIINMQK